MKKTPKMMPIDELKKKLFEIAHLRSLLALAHWDQEVYMPKNAAQGRAAAIAQLSGIIHDAFTAIDSDGLLTNLKKQLDSKELKEKDAVVVFETWRTFERERKLPTEFVKEMAELTSNAQRIWVEAREKNNFKLFAPWLAKVVDLKRKEAQYIGYEKSPYDALIDEYEPGMTAEKASQILDNLKDFLMPFVKKIASSKLKIDTKIFKGNFPLDKQAEFNELVARGIGFDFDSGRLDITTHPFASGFHPNDVRITTRYRKDDVLYSLGSTIHETGHAMYEQGLPAEYFGTPLADAVSLGIHESQSRMWENLIGKSSEFCKYLHSKLQKAFPDPFKKVSVSRMYNALNKVTPSLIRTESDEVTYNLHIIIRFEIEREMIEGTIDINDLPRIWNEKMKQYLGIKVPNDKLGVLQDVHWSMGAIGYFPTYSFGNLYSAQFFASMKKDIPDLGKKISQGKFDEIKKWLRKNIHVHGKTYSAEQLVKKVTGESLTSSYFIDYLKEKYEKIYFK